MRGNLMEMDGLWFSVGKTGRDFTTRMGVHSGGVAENLSEPAAAMTSWGKRRDFAAGRFPVCQL
jgi:hypothetical protein